MNSKSKIDHQCSPQDDEERAFFKNVRTSFHCFFKPIPAARLGPTQLTAPEEQRQQKAFSAWIDDFEKRGGFRVLWKLYSRHGVEPDTVVMLLTWFQMRDMEWIWIEKDDRIKKLRKGLQNQGGRRKVSDKLQHCATKLDECAYLIAVLRLILMQGETPHQRVFPLEIPPRNLLKSLRRTSEVVEDLRLVASWIHNLSSSRRGAEFPFEKWHRAISIRAYIVGISGNPLNAYVSRLLQCAFPSMFPSGEKTTMVKLLNTAKRELGLAYLPVTSVPAKLKKAAQAKQRHRN